MYSYLFMIIFVILKVIYLLIIKIALYECMLKTVHDKSKLLEKLLENKGGL